MGIASFNNVWHKAPTMTGTGSLTIYRTGGTIYGSIVAENQITSTTGYFNSGYIIVQVISSTRGVVWSQNLNAPFSRTSKKSISGDFSYNDNDAQDFYVHYTCKQNGKDCEAKAVGSPFNDVDMGITLHEDSYNPWSDPSPISNLNVSSTYLKPDESIYVSWSSAQAGMGNSIGQYSICYQIYRNGSWGNRIVYNGYILDTGIYIPLSNLNLRPRR